MRLPSIVATIFMLGAVAAAGAHAQGSCTFTDESGKTVTLPNCASPDEKPDAAKKTTAPAATGNRFAFPGEEPARPAPLAPATTAPATPAQQPPANGVPQAKRYAFPGDDAAAPATPSPLQDAGSSGTPPADQDSSGSSSSSSSSAPGGTGPLAGDDDEAAAKVAARRRTKLPKGPRQTPDEQEEEDLKVAAFYQSDGNFTAAYSRATDAVKLVDDDLYAHLALAEAARRLGKFDEAQQHYKRTLALDPPDKQRKIAEHALKEMAGGH